MPGLMEEAIAPPARMDARRKRQTKAKGQDSFRGESICESRRIPDRSSCFSLAALLVCGERGGASHCPPLVPPSSTAPARARRKTSPSSTENGRSIRDMGPSSKTPVPAGGHRVGPQRQVHRAGSIVNAHGRVGAKTEPQLRIRLRRDTRRHALTRSSGQAQNGIAARSHVVPLPPRHAGGRAPRSTDVARPTSIGDIGQRKLSSRRSGQARKHGKSPATYDGARCDRLICHNVATE